LNSLATIFIITQSLSFFFFPLTAVKSSTNRLCPPHFSFPPPKLNSPLKSNSPPSRHYSRITNPMVLLPQDRKGAPFFRPPPRAARPAPTHFPTQSKVFFLPFPSLVGPSREPTVRRGGEKAEWLSCSTTVSDGSRIQIQSDLFRLALRAMWSRRGRSLPLHKPVSGFFSLFFFFIFFFFFSIAINVEF